MEIDNCSWRCAGRSIAGSAHVEAGIPCQDFLKITKSNNRSIVAIADGAGSAKHCETGAKIAVETLSESLAEFPSTLVDISEDSAIEFGRRVRERLLEQCLIDEADISDYACTLLAAVFEEQFAYFWQIGDGAWIVECGDTIECATWPSKGEFNNQTSFITSADWETQITPALFENASSAIGFTDGLEMFLLDSSARKPHLPFTIRILSALRNDPSEEDIMARIQQMLTSSVITEREDDDLTLAVVWKAPRNDPR